jgi:hypothetical protein
VNEKVQKYSIALAWVSANDSPSGVKKRPVYIVNTNGVNVMFLAITTKYANKSTFLKQFFLPILDWKQSGLDAPCYINTFDIYNVPISDISTHFIGNLSERDTDRLLALLKKRNEMLAKG